MRSQSYPASIPDAYASQTDLSDAYRAGWNHGHGIACHNVPTIGARIFSDSLGRVTVNAANVREVHEAACFEAADNARQYSPFEFTAHAFNQYGDGGWFILPYGEDKRGPFDSEAEARAEADEDDDIAELPSSEEVWQAFEAGQADAIAADLATYDDADYGIADNA
jgi:hypothetical protein